MKRSPLRKQSKVPISKLQRDIWELCKQIVRKKYPHKCYTCGKRIYSKYDLHTGHVPWPKASLGAYLKYDLRLLKIQCYSCNIHKGGMGAEAYKRMLKEEGELFMAQLERDRNKLVKAYDHYLKVLSEYQKIADEIQPTN